MRRHNGAMATIQIKNVPEETHATLTLRAKAAHQSLQQYVLSRLIADSSRPTPEDYWASLPDMPPGEGITLGQATQAVREDRDSR
jgi:hypothetical protein